MRGGQCEEQGLIPRTVKFLLHSQRQLGELDWQVGEELWQHTQFSFSASFLEVYNDEIFDLLADGRRKLELKVREGKGGLDRWAVDGSSWRSCRYILFSRWRTWTASF